MHPTFLNSLESSIQRRICIEEITQIAPNIHQDNSKTNKRMDELIIIWETWLEPSRIRLQLGETSIIVRIELYRGVLTEMTLTGENCYRELLEYLKRIESRDGLHAEIEVKWVLAYIITGSSLRNCWRFRYSGLVLRQMEKWDVANIDVIY